MSLTKVSYSMITGEVINVLDYGAVGDGTTDDTVAIQAAVTAAFTPVASNYGGGKLFFPRGTYKITSAIVLPNSQFYIYGEGTPSVISCVGCSAFLYAGQFTTISQLSDLYIIGDNTAGTEAFNSSPSNTAFVFAEVQFNKLRIGGFPRHFNIPNAQLCSWSDCLMDLDTGGSAFYIHPTASGQAANSNRVVRCQFTGVGSPTVDFDPGAFAANCSNWLFDSCDFQQSSSGIPLTIKDSNWIVRSCEFENSTGVGTIDIITSDTLSADYTLIDGCVFAGSASTGQIRIFRTGTVQQTYYTTIRNCSHNPSLPIVWIDSGRSTIVENCNGTITGSGGEYTIEIGGSNQLSTTSFSGIGMKVNSTIWTSGAGSPEGVVTAIIGSLYTRLNGGAGTTLYVKESGTGNTGWVAK